MILNELHNINQDTISKKNTDISKPLFKLDRGHVFVKFFSPIVQGIQCRYFTGKPTELIPRGSRL
jgi:hypothetical protein